jgi:UDP-4-amino-4,6-dideoxy-N-acetyl-beta-L-altrosamine N-acetyltransferase
MIKFREITYDDLEMIRLWRTSKEVTQHMYTDPNPTKDEQVRWYESLKSNKSVMYKIICYDDTPIGMVYLTNIDYNSKHCEWGIYIGDLKYQSRGAGALATYKLINYVFYELGMNKLMSMVLTTNSSSIKLTESFGFCRNAYYKEHCYKNGEFIDMIGFSMLKRDWVKLNEYFKIKFK